MLSASRNYILINTHSLTLPQSESACLSHLDNLFVKNSSDVCAFCFVRAHDAYYKISDVDMCAARGAMGENRGRAARRKGGARTLP
jgi:hypothetical protein